MNVRQHRRGFARLVAATLLLAAVVGLVAAPASAHDGLDHDPADGSHESDTPQIVGDESPRLIVVVEVNGLIDPIMASYIKRQLVTATGLHAVGVVLQVDSAGSTLHDDELVELLDSVRLAHLPVGVWVGPSGAQALGGAAHLVTAADFAAIAPGGRIGDFTAVEGLVHAHGSGARGVDRGSVHSHEGDGLHSGTSVRYYDADTAMGAGLTHSTAPVIGEFLFAMSDEGLLPPIGQNVTGDDGVIRRAPADDVVVSFVKLPLLDGLFHTAASPAVAYLLLLAGLSLLLLDFYTGGIGIAAVVAAVCGLLAAFGLGTLDIRLWALALLVAGFVAFAVDIQTGVPRFWTAAGGAAVLAGSLTLFGQHSMSWIPLLVGLVGVGAFVLSGLPALVRTRYGTATVGREWLIGVEGTAVTDIDPDGTVEVHGARWRARVNRLTPLQAGEPLRVSGLSGVVLEVEPLEGAAVDYRQMRRGPSGPVSPHPVETGNKSGK
ncbi:NfeD family protein [Candidatus Poriferisodalis sp.]|uniref:NfeD family protein n=1 Tax=Candidatus Poriferisodalis sp. TaxID=3101277 RepID=UPI003B5C636D